RRSLSLFRVHFGVEVRRVKQQPPQGSRARTETVPCAAQQLRSFGGSFMNFSRRFRHTQKSPRKTRLRLETLESRELLTVNSTMAQALALRPDSAVTTLALQSGNWSDPNIWQNGTVPDANANVLIPSQTTVTLDTISNPVHVVRVDGTLQFATDVDTTLLVDTLVVNMAGSLIIGTAANPLPANHHAAITFTSDS